MDKLTVQWADDNKGLLDRAAGLDWERIVEIVLASGDADPEEAGGKAEEGREAVESQDAPAGRGASSWDSAQST